MFGKTNPQPVLSFSDCALECKKVASCCFSVRVGGYRRQAGLRLSPMTCPTFNLIVIALLLRLRVVGCCCCALMSVDLTVNNSSPRDCEIEALTSPDVLLFLKLVAQKWLEREK